jgi:hypothetical protein
MHHTLYGVTLMGVIIFSFLLPMQGHPEQTLPPTCPALPEQPSGNTVTLYVAKASLRVVEELSTVEGAVGWIAVVGGSVNAIFSGWVSKPPGGGSD